MSSVAKAAYRELIDSVERHQVTQTVRDQVEFITELRDALTLKLSGLRGGAKDDDD